MNLRIKALLFFGARKFLISNLFFLLLVFPALGTAFGLPSMSYGTLISALIIIAYGVCVNKYESIFFFRGAVLKILISIPIVISIHTLAIFFFQNQAVDFSRLIISILLLEIILVAVVFLKKLIIDVNQKDFDFCIKYIFVILIVAAFLGIFGHFSFGRAGKPVVFFNEPSHFALVFLPFFLWSLFRFRNILIKYLLLLLVFYIALLIQSMVLLIVVIAAAFITMRFKNTVIILFILFIFYSGFNSWIRFYSEFNKTNNLNINHSVIVESNSNEQYFKERLPILNEETELFADKTINYFELPGKYLDLLIRDSYNGSLLVMISGWERAVINLKDSRAMGFGFQQFGIRGRWGNATLKLVSIYGVPLCITDGGSITPKVIGEFGFLGTLLILIYSKFSFLKLREFRRYCINPFVNADLKYIFYVTCIIGFIVSMFIRGVGYFTAESFLFFLGVFSVLIKKN
jgi:hypothetical protein